MEKATENWIGEQCNEIEERKNNSERAYQLMKDLTSVKQRKTTTVQDRSGKCLTEERQILNRWTEHCFELYNYKAKGDPSVVNCPQTNTGDDRGRPPHPSQQFDNTPAELVQTGVIHLAVQ